MEWTSPHRFTPVCLLLGSACVPQPYSDQKQEIEGLQRLVGELQAQVTSLEGAECCTDLTELAERVSLIEGDYLRSDDIGDFVQIIREDTTMNVGPDYEYADLASALAWLDGYVIASGATVTLQLQDGTYSPVEAIEVRHANGANIHILGNAADPSAVRFEFAGTSGFVVQDGAALGYLDYMAISGNGTGDTAGIAALDNASIKLGDHLSVDSFGSYGLYAAYGGQIRDEGDDEASAISADSNSIGFMAYQGGGIWLGRGATAEGNGAYGFVAAESAWIEARGAIATNDRIGFSAQHLGVLRVEEATAKLNSMAGFYAVHSGMISAGSARAIDSGYEGFDSRSFAHIYAANSEATSATAWCYYTTTGGTMDATDSISACPAGDYVQGWPDDTYDFILR